MDTELFVKYPDSFIKVLSLGFPNDHELHRAAQAGKYSLGHLIIECAKNNPENKKQYLSLFSKWCSLPGVCDVTARVMLS